MIYSISIIEYIHNIFFFEGNTFWNYLDHLFLDKSLFSYSVEFLFENVTALWKNAKIRRRLLFRFILKPLQKKKKKMRAATTELRFQ